MRVFLGNVQGILSKAVILDLVHSEDQHTLQFWLDMSLYFVEFWNSSQSYKLNLVKIL